MARVERTIDRYPEAIINDRKLMIKTLQATPDMLREAGGPTADPTNRSQE